MDKYRILELRCKFYPQKLITTKEFDWFMLRFKTTSTYMYFSSTLPTVLYNIELIVSFNTHEAALSFIKTHIKKEMSNKIHEVTL